MHLNVAYGCNNAYIEYTGISLISLFENNKEFEKITIYFIDMGISDDSKQILEEIASEYNRIITFIEFNKLCEGLTISSIGRHIESIYAKLFFSRLEEIDKILYLDSDTIVAGSLKKLWSLDLGNNLIAGVQTISSIKRNNLVGLDSSNPFINDGVVLINLVQWRKERTEEKFLDYIKMHNGNPPILSEGTINAVCKEKIIVLDPRYNLLSGIIYYTSQEIKRMSGVDYYTKKQLDDAKKTPIIIHYLCGFYNRPWCEGSSHPLKEYFTFYKARSPWKDKPLIIRPLPVRLRAIDFLHRSVPFEVFLILQKILGKK